MTDTFTAAAMCPTCGMVAVHGMRQPNSEPPKQIHEPETEELWVWGEYKPIAVYQNDGLDRWDERPYEIIRTCNRCGKEWGQQ